MLSERETPSFLKISVSSSVISVIMGLPHEIDDLEYVLALVDYPFGEHLSFRPVAYMAFSSV